MKDSEIPQFFKPYESTIAFNKTLFNLGLLNGNTKNIIDIGTGIGANLQYFSNKNNHINFLGTDYDYNRLNKGRKLNKNSKIKFKYYNALKKNRSLRNKFEGVICIHTLCCFKNLDKVLTNICKINANWIAINSLFFDGTLDVLDIVYFVDMIMNP